MRGVAMLRIMLLSIFIAGSALFVSSAAPAQDASPAFTKRPADQLVIRARGPGGYRLDIYEPAQDEDSGWLLLIGTSEGLHFYSEMVDDSPVTAYCVDPGCDFLITIWSYGARTYAVRVYHAFDQLNVRRVLETYASGMPDAVSRTGRAPEITTINYESGPSDIARAWRETWRWDGKEYKSTGDKCIRNCNRSR
jgi:hypothetical protein